MAPDAHKPQEAFGGSGVETSARTAVRVVICLVPEKADEISQEASGTISTEIYRQFAQRELGRRRSLQPHQFPCICEPVPLPRFRFLVPFLTRDSGSPPSSALRPSSPRFPRPAVGSILTEDALLERDPSPVVPALSAGTGDPISAGGIGEDVALPDMIGRFKRAIFAPSGATTTTTTQTAALSTSPATVTSSTTTTETTDSATSSTTAASSSNPPTTQTASSSTPVTSPSTTTSHATSGSSSAISSSAPPSTEPSTSGGAGTVTIQTTAATVTVGGSETVPVVTSVTTVVSFTITASPSLSDTSTAPAVPFPGSSGGSVIVVTHTSLSLPPTSSASDLPTNGAAALTHLSEPLHYASSRSLSAPLFVKMVMIHTYAALFAVYLSTYAGVGAASVSRIADHGHIANTSAIASALPSDVTASAHAHLGPDPFVKHTSTHRSAATSASTSKTRGPHASAALAA
ncbi:hypothetical protein DICSQDRAFT_169681 [Dichomitus squalens LYAD-421 SS1]|uniref:Uncharacterized protein n=1 Tax=Dichomitus squalens (strain LYAD-421) TaxID=732165 RepID=R7T1H0_DICSQ|nr:uncharacterized protein DICSQDRAFT_169681 [Dichomitus squalens LYAD-421 SS1]EJF62108.1 hypothetical protein DICSQDRAFT_169681 [Dichomitus squalens LYAD-421 SS1]